jgi:hypothetical protein
MYTVWVHVYIYSLFFIMGPCYLNVLQVIYHIHQWTFITYTTVNIDVRTTNLNIALSSRKMMMMTRRCPSNEAADLWRVDCWKPRPSVVCVCVCVWVCILIDEEDWRLIRGLTWVEVRMRERTKPLVSKRKLIDRQDADSNSRSRERSRLWLLAH